MKIYIKSQILIGLLLLSFVTSSQCSEESDEEEINNKSEEEEEDEDNGFVESEEIVETKPALNSEAESFLASRDFRVSYNHDNTFWGIYVVRINFTCLVHNNWCGGILGRSFCDGLCLPLDGSCQEGL